MRVFHPFFIGISIIVLIALNIYVIPQQRKVQLQLEKKAIWKIPIQAGLDWIITPYSLIELMDSEPIFQLKSIDKKTGKTIKLKDFPDEIGAARKVDYVGDAIYVIFIGSNIYKLDSKTLEVLWKVDCNLDIYNWEAINMEQSRELLFIHYNDYHTNFYTFLEQETGVIYYEEKNPRNSTQTYAIPAIFAPQEESNWARYHHFKNQNFIFDKTTKELLFVDAEQLMSPNDSLKLISFKARANNYYRQINSRYNSLDSFVTREELIYLTNGIPQAYEKSITSIQVSSKTILFRFEKVDNLKYSNRYPNTADYTFLEKEKDQTSLSLQNISVDASSCLSDNYFVTIQTNSTNVNYNQRYKEIVIIDLNKLDFKEALYLPFEQKIKQLLCDEEQLYVFVQASNGDHYCVAVPLD